MKYGFLFGAGAEAAYGLPSGGKFALEIFRQNTPGSDPIKKSHLKKWMRKKQSPYIRIEMRRKKYFVQINLTWVITVCELLLRKLHQIKYLLDLLP